MDGLDHRLVLLWARNRQNIRVGGRNAFRLRAHASGDDDFAIFFEGVSDRGERLGLGAIKKTAGVHDDKVGPLAFPRQLIALRAQTRDDALAVDQRLRAAKRDKAHFRRCGIGFCSRITHGRGG
jgi:hypothetical protein